MGNHIVSMFYGLNNHAEFVGGMQHAINQVAVQDGIFAGDQLFTYNRNLSFLQDERFMSAFFQHAETDVEKSLIWRFSVLCWAAKNAMRLEGDFVEAACYRGTTARIICDYVDFAEQTNRSYYLYDLFDHDETMPHHAMPEHSKELYDKTKKRFELYPNTHITQGKLPDSLSIAAPEKIAFFHLDINNADAEIGTLELLFDRMVPGAILILDDYGWLYYRDQKLAEDPWFSKRGYQVLELPTGQGMIIK